jgi:nitrate/nitrite transporter NarK
MPKKVLGLVAGLVNAFGNLGGFAGPYVVGRLSKKYHSTAIPFNALGVGMLICAGLAFLLPKPRVTPAVPKPGAPSVAEVT